MAHLASLHSVGGSNPININRTMINFNPYYSLQDILGFIMIIIFISYMIFQNPNFLNHSDNYIPADPLITPSKIVPEIYLLPFYAILRAIPNKTLGVIAMMLSILILIILSFTQIHFINTSF
jgi:quinol-cytochrome oxidoreductase complex cytochrome b subunit